MTPHLDPKKLPAFWALVDDIVTNTVALLQISVVEYDPAAGTIISSEGSETWLPDDEETRYQVVAEVELPKRSNVDSFIFNDGELLLEFVHFRRLKPTTNTHLVVGFLYDAAAEREAELDQMGYAKEALQLALLDDLLEIKMKPFTEARRRKPATARGCSGARMTSSKSELILLREALESVVPRDDYKKGVNMLPVPLTRNQFMTLVRTTEAAISFHDIESWDKKTKGVIKALFDVLVEFEKLGPQVHKTFSAWIPIKRILKTTIKKNARRA